MSYKDIDFTEIDYLAYDLYKNAIESDKRFVVLTMRLFVIFHSSVTEDDFLLSEYYDLAKIQLRKNKLENLQKL